MTAVLFKVGIACFLHITIKGKTYLLSFERFNEVLSSLDLAIVPIPDVQQLQKQFVLHRVTSHRIQVAL